MKHYLFLGTIFIILNSSTAQKAITFNEAIEKGISIEQLDSIYLSGVHAESELGVFNDNVEEYTQAYQSLLQDLGNFLVKNNFVWKSRTQSFNRIYFDKNGTIDYFLFNFRPNQISLEEEGKFKELLNKFINDYQFGLTAEVKFAQCSPVSYKP